MIIPIRPLGHMAGHNPNPLWKVWQYQIWKLSEGGVYSRTRKSFW